VETRSINTSLAEIAEIAIERQGENDQFRSFLETHDEQEIDALVARLDGEISPSIDCTSCGNCCKSLMVNINDEEADKLAQHLEMSRIALDEKYIEKGSNGMMLLNAIPCHFLSDNKCTVYEYRFAGCREFPALHLPGFKKRLFTTFMHYDRCPIIFNVVEQLKRELDFHNN
jgi:Fe-S-cluster containining protein